MKTSFVNGEFVEGVGSKANINPSDTDDVVDQIGEADAVMATRAIDAAAAASRAWRQTNVQRRADALDAIGAELLGRKEELGTLLSREQGKTLPEGLAEVERAGRIFKFFAGEAVRPAGVHAPSVRDGIEIIVTSEPLGVVGIISPWNFPMAIPAWKIAPALAYGNAVVFKPAELVPSSAWALTEIISRSGLPDGAFNLVLGAGRVVGNAMLEDPRVKGISFTGSTGVGARVMETAGRRFAKLQLEMGGKNPLVVLDDADLEVALNCAVQGSFYSTGQRCTASSRIICTKGIYPTFRKALVERVAALRVGHALHSATQVGPVVDKSQLESNLRYVSVGRDEGATLVCGGGAA